MYVTLKFARRFFNLANISLHGARLPSFRVAVLKQRPILLYDVLKKAISSRDLCLKRYAGIRWGRTGLTGLQYATTCVFLLLSLSSSLSEPAILPKLLIRLLHKAVQDPTATNIKLVYHVLSGPNFDLLNIISVDLFIELQENLLQILRVLEATDHLANIFCLAIFAVCIKKFNASSYYRPVFVV